MERTRPRSPLFQRSRSGTPRLCHVSTPETPPLSLNVGRTTLPARSKSAVKARASSDTAAAAPIRRKPKENRESPSHRPPDAGANARMARPGGALSAWALSPGRYPAAAAEPLGFGGEKKRGGGVMGYFRKRKGTSEREEAVHQLRMVTSRLIQWRFVNARAESAMESVRSSAETKLFFAWLRINELRNIVAAKRILIQRRKHKMKLARLLNPQIHILNQWEPLAKRHLDSVAALSKVLESMCLPLPLIEGAQANLVLLHKYISMSMDFMIEIEAAIRIFYTKVEKVSTLLSELVKNVGQEMEGLEELMKMSKRITSLEVGEFNMVVKEKLLMHETSLRANLIQAMKKEVEPPPISTLGLRLAWQQLHQWHI